MSLCTKTRRNERYYTGKKIATNTSWSSSAGWRAFPPRFLSWVLPLVRASYPYQTHQPIPLLWGAIMKSMKNVILAKYGVDKTFPEGKNRNMARWSCHLGLYTPNMVLKSHQLLGPELHGCGLQLKDLWKNGLSTGNKCSLLFKWHRKG